jgi:hypothetical protein
LPEASVALRAARSEPPPVSAAVRPWSSEQALLHTLVFGNDGRVINRVVTHRDAEDSVQQLAIEAPQRWFEAQRGAHRLLIYAHGGMTSEHDSVRRIQVLAPYFHANGIYPLFLTWKTGPLETLGDILADQLRRVPRPDGGVWDRFREIGANVLDRTLEVVAGPVVKPIWTQMKQNAAMAVEPGMGLDLLARALARLDTRVPRLQIHFAGHSAGAILLGHLLTRLGRGSLRVKSCSLYAPSCTVAFALQHYARAFRSRLLSMRSTHLHVLSDRLELEDSVGPYRKSVLYLISRALEASHKTAVLGLQSASVAPPTPVLWHHDQRELVQRWQALWGADNPNLHVLDAAQVSTGRFGQPLRTTHTCFDNAAPVIDATLARILGQQPRYPVEWLGY